MKTLQIVDLTHPIQPGQPVYPGDPALRLTPHACIQQGGFRVTEAALSLHHGTHLDVPAHVFEGGQTLEEVKLTALCGPASRIDLAPGGALPAGSTITPEMLEPFTQRFTPGARMLIRTGWDGVYPAPEFFTDAPCLTPDAARWVVERKIGLLGLDIPNGGPEALEVHRTLLDQDAGVLLVVCLANMHALPDEFPLFILPLPFTRCEASPVRAIAVISRQE